MIRRAQAGFTLLEIIIAFGVLALALTLLLGTLSGASRQLRQGGDAGVAALHAQSLLAERAELALQPGQWQGQWENGRYRWTLAIAPWQDPSASRRQAPVDPYAARLLHLQLQVEWGKGDAQQRLQLSSLRLQLPLAADTAGAVRR